jgi:hypothetical protein
MEKYEKWDQNQAEKQNHCHDANKDVVNARLQQFRKVIFLGHVRVIANRDLLSADKLIEGRAIRNAT